MALSQESNQTNERAVPANGTVGIIGGQSPQNILTTVANWNNLGVAHFEDRDFQDAMFLFRDALRYVTNPLNVRDSETFSRSIQTNITAHETSRYSEAIQISDYRTPVLKSTQYTEERIRLADYEDDQSYTQAIDVVATPLSYSTDIMTGQVFISAIIIWNLALIYDVKSENKADRIQKARSLYHNSWNLVRNTLEEGSTGNPLVDFFALALLNNLAECSYKLQESDNTRYWSERLVVYAQTIPVTYGDEEDNLALDGIIRERTNQFMLNATMRLQPLANTAASAA